MPAKNQGKKTAGKAKSRVSKKSAAIKNIGKSISIEPCPLFNYPLIVRYDIQTKGFSDVD